MTRSLGKKGLKSERLAPFAPIFRDEMLSRAFQELSPSAVKALIYFRWIQGVVKKKTGDPTASFDFTYDEAESYGFARRTFSRVVQQLVDTGFIDIVRQGGLRGCGRSNSHYKASERWRLYGISGFVKSPRYRPEP